MGISRVFELEAVLFSASFVHAQAVSLVPSLQRCMY
jgi:hypothetical protein